jgi:hypothetical protein
MSMLAGFRLPVSLQPKIYRTLCFRGLEQVTERLVVLDRTVFNPLPMSKGFLVRRIESIRSYS